MVCPICEHPHRHSIETAVLNGVDFAEIVQNFSSQKDNHKFTVDHLKIHSLCHMVLPTKKDESMAAKLGVKEAETLTVAYNEYLATLQRLSGVINVKLGEVERNETQVRHAFTKPLVDLYLGTGKQINDTIKLLADINAEMNAENNSRNRTGLEVLSSALDRSRQQLSVIKTGT